MTNIEQPRQSVANEEKKLQHHRRNYLSLTFAFMSGNQKNNCMNALSSITTEKRKEKGEKKKPKQAGIAMHTGDILTESHAILRV